ncbi:hypothetical protein G3480_21575 [Thiorhodococcus mannitoliphagus]|uniref:Uncharacterized protein n=1 Tax=Thiorhodococcus mannitoliphagus TaxID=329406 RepID=A0A6P1DYV6_9GAMM|nr:hypothetical protein [Thiorhodococcus mannitoliphagus]NEX22859.1 hypothetical protein [Thiorhodococcus mannitoliphagus]
MALKPVHYRVVGQDDYMLDIRVEASGAYRIDCGDHSSHKPRRGQLTVAEQARLQALIEALGEPCEHPAPEGASGFVAELRVGSAPDVGSYRFWEGALEQAPDLHALVRALEVI